MTPTNSPRALIPDAADASGREWRAYARTFLAALLHQHTHRVGQPLTWQAPPQSLQFGCCPNALPLFTHANGSTPESDSSKRPLRGGTSQER